ncbi:hypothetical protein JAAARDRAFT_134675, partial [Jaapia argillacea MUCL 33604]
QEPSFRIVPAANSGKTATIKDTANSFGLHDTLQYGPRSLATEIKAPSVVKNRLENWEETQDNVKLTMKRNVDGMHAPLRLLMERKIVAANPQIPALSQSNLALDILMGRDEELDVGDFFGGMERGPTLDVHNAMEKKLRM